MANVCNYTKRILLCCFLPIIFILINAVCAEAEELYTFSDENILNTRINIKLLNDENVFILPSAMKAESVMLFGDFADNSDVVVKGALKAESFTSGKKINLNEFCKSGDYQLVFSDKKGTFDDFTVKFLFSENIPAVFLVSDNPEENGRLWVEDSTDKSNKATGSIIIQKSDGKTVYDGALTQIKGRGNSTWDQIKKPYQIKTKTEVDLLETGNDDNKSKTWLLLANYLDPTLLNNSVVLNMGKSLGMKANVESAYVDLYYDGEYRGNYLLSEKVEPGAGRVAIVDLDEKNTAANDSADIESLPSGTSETENGAFFKYCENMLSPEDISGGYLLEMDYEVRAKEEACYFRSKRGQYVVVKSPEFASREEMEYIASLYQEYEDSVYNGGVNPTTGKLYTDYVDGDSLACYYLLNEFSKARDFFSSSAYLYKNAGEDKMYMGPLWDYDLSFAGGRFEEGETEHPQGASVHNTDFGEKLIEIEGFAQLLQKLYKDRLLPIINSMISENDSLSEIISLAAEREKIRASATINTTLWHNDKDWEEEADKLGSFIKERAYYMEKLLNQYSADNYAKNRFKDVFESDWYYSDVDKVTSLGYMNGVSKEFFDPYSNVNRSEIAQVLFNMSSRKKSTNNKSFADVKETDWFYDAIMWTTSEEIMDGFVGGVFMPKKLITREELVVCLYKYKKEPKIKNYSLSEFSDESDVSADAKNALQWATDKKIIIGDTHGRLNPKANLTRAEMAAILVRFNSIAN